jgi:hypothetical protein
MKNAMPIPVPNNTQAPSTWASLRTRYELIIAHLVPADPAAYGFHDIAVMNTVVVNERYAVGACADGSSNAERRPVHTGR